MSNVNIDIGIDTYTDTDREIEKRKNGESLSKNRKPRKTIKLFSKCMESHGTCLREHRKVI